MKEVKVIIGTTVEVKLFLNTGFPTPHIGKIHGEIGPSHEAQFKIMVKNRDLTKKRVWSGFKLALRGTGEIGRG